jgi:hypothetical protein
MRTPNDQTELFSQCLFPNVCKDEPRNSSYKKLCRTLPTTPTGPRKLYTPPAILAPFTSLTGTLWRQIWIPTSLLVTSGLNRRTLKIVAIRRRHEPWGTCSVLLCVTKHRWKIVDQNVCSSHSIAPLPPAHTHTHTYLTLFSNDVSKFSSSIKKMF